MRQSILQKIVFLFLSLAAIAGTPVFAQSTPISTKPEPYLSEEFPAWANSLRRSEIVAFGSLPFTVFFTTFAMDSYRYSQNNWDQRYAPWPLKAAGAIEMDESQRIGSFVTACAISVVISLVDYALIRSKRRAEQRKAEAKTYPSIQIERNTWPSETKAPDPETP